MYSKETNNLGSDSTPNHPVARHPAITGLRNVLHAGIFSVAALAGGSVCESCVPDTGTEEPAPASKMTYEKGNWKFDVMETKEQAFQLEPGQRFFYDYIKGKLSKTTGADLSHGPDMESFTDAYIDITRKLNPDLNLDNSEEIAGKKIILPTTVHFTPGNGKFFRSRVGYEYLREAARADGMDIGDPSKRDGIFAEASKLPLMPDSQYYRCKDPASDCKEAFAPHAQQTYEKFAKEFYDRSIGVMPVYNDLMRDEEEEKSILQKGKGGTELGSTHITGNSLDQAVYGYIIKGEYVYYGKATDEQKADIDKRLKPLLAEILSEYFKRGEILVLDETHGNTPHYHLYFPAKVTPLHPQEIKLDLSAAVATPALQMRVGESDGIRYYTFTVPAWTLERFAEKLCPSSNVGTLAAIKQYNKTDHIAPGDVIRMPLDFMKHELRDPELILVDEMTAAGIDKDILELYNPAHESGAYKVPKALLTPQP